MAIRALQELEPAEVRVALASFRPTYVRDWDRWLSTPIGRRPIVMGEILRKWQATRPYPMRRAQHDATHPSPYIDDLLKAASGPVSSLTTLDVTWMILRSAEPSAALNELWSIFSGLTTKGVASCVGISKAVLLATDGRIGPALDSNVRNTLGVRHPTSASQWLDVLEDVGSDISAFEKQHGSLSTVVPHAFANLGYGRIYDMVFGPKGAS